MQKKSIYDRMTNAEREVTNVLKEFGIQWTYEQPVLYELKKETTGVGSRFLSTSIWDLFGGLWVR